MIEVNISNNLIMKKIIIFLLVFINIKLFSQESKEISFEIKFLDISKFQLRIINRTNKTICLLFDPLNIKIINNYYNETFDMTSNVLSNTLIYYNKNLIPYCILYNPDITNYFYENCKKKNDFEEYLKNNTINLNPYSSKIIIYDLKKNDKECYLLTKKIQKIKFRLAYFGNDIKKSLDDHIKTIGENSSNIKSYNNLFFDNIYSNYANGKFFVNENRPPSALQSKKH